MQDTGIFSPPDVCETENAQLDGALVALMRLAISRGLYSPALARVAADWLATYVQDDPGEIPDKICDLHKVSLQGIGECDQYVDEIEDLLAGCDPDARREILQELLAR